MPEPQSQEVIMSEEDDTSSERDEPKNKASAKKPATRLRKMADIEEAKAPQVQYSPPTVAFDETPTNIENLLGYIRSSNDTVCNIAKNTNLNFNLIRLMKHQLSKVEKNDLFTQPFSFLRPLDRVKQYDYSAGKIFQTTNSSFDIGQTPDFVG
jgi:hypothetical protein